MLELLAEQLSLSLKKPLFRNYHTAHHKSGSSSTVHLVKPLTYMNRSGEILPALMKKSRTEMSGLIVITDNMDLPPGKIRMKFGGSSAGHNGLKSIMAHTDSSDFYRLYIGVGRPEKGHSVVDHVLGDFSQDHRALMEEAVRKATSAFLTLGEASPGQVMNVINSGKS